MLVVGQQIIVVLTSTSWGSSSVVSGKIRKRLELPESGAIQLPCSHEPPSFFLSTYVHPPVRCSIERMRTEIFSGHQTDLTSQRDTTALRQYILNESYRIIRNKLEPQLNMRPADQICCSGSFVTPNGE